MATGMEMENWMEMMARNLMLPNSKSFRLISFHKWYCCVKCLSNKTTTLTAQAWVMWYIENTKSKLNSSPH